MFTLQQLHHIATNYAYRPVISLGTGLQEAATIDLPNGLYAAVIEQVDDSGRVVDAVLTYRGTEHDSLFGATINDRGNGAESVVDAPLRDVPSDLLLDAGVSAGTQAPDAAAFFFSQVERYAAMGVKLNVTGQSLGGGLANYAVGAALDRYGAESPLVPQATVFAALNVANALAADFGQSVADVDGRIIDYLLENDIFFGPDPGIPLGQRILSESELGVRILLPAFQPNPEREILGIETNLSGAFINSGAAHLPARSYSVYNQMFGIPDGVTLPVSDPFFYQELSLPSPLNPVYLAVGEMLGLYLPTLLAPGGTAVGSYGRYEDLSLRVFGDGADNVLRGGNADDTFHTGGGSDRIDGGAGVDTLVLRGTMAQYRRVATAEGLLLVGSGESARLTGVERLVFADGERTAAEAQLTLSVVTAAEFVVADAAIAARLGLSAPPAVTFDAGSVAEDAAPGSVIGRVAATAAGGAVQAVRYSLVAGGEGLAIDAATGVLSVVGSLDYEHGATLSPVVRAVNADGLFTDSTIGIAIADRNEQPAARADAVRVDEDAESGNLWSLLLGNDVDPDAGDLLSIAAAPATGTLGSLRLDREARSLIYVADHDGFDDLAAGATQVDTFTYTVRDSAGLPSTASVAVTVTGMEDGESLRGSRRGDVLLGGNGEDVLDSGRGADRLEGGAGHDRLLGGRGNDRLFGDDGRDWLLGGRDRDWLDGGAGNDRIDGGSGNDTLSGGAGRDTFVFGHRSERDMILDFDVAADTILLVGGVRVTRQEQRDFDGDGVIDTRLHLGGKNHVTVSGVTFPEIQFGDVAGEAASASATTIGSPGGEWDASLFLI